VIELAFAGCLAAAIAALVTSTSVDFVSRLALAFRAVDYPGGRRGHESAVPRLGGLALGLGLFFGAGSVALLQWGTWGGRVARSELLAFVLASGIVFLLGLADDLVGVSIARKFTIETLAAVIVVWLGWHFTAIGLPGGGSLALGPLGYVLTVAWIVGVTNAINLLDGLDGLAGGVVAIIAVTYLVYAALQGNPMTVVLMAGIAGACLGFLRHNARGQIFLGDAGSLLLGFILATMSVHSSLKASAAVAILVPLLALGVPIIDALLVMGVRFLERPHNRGTERFLRMFRADRNHLHHLLLSLARSRAQVVRLIYVMVVLACVFAITVAVARSLTVGLIMLGVELIAVAVIRRFGFAARLREMSEAQRKEVRVLLVEETPPGP
jgi:UDP-GlcNAc:undecaprenyl-phosphate GlcNAc-1-phosphate transferase